VISLEDEILQRREEIPRAHATVLIDFDQKFNHVPVHSFVVVLDEFDSDDLLEEDVDLSASVAG